MEKIDNTVGEEYWRQRKQLVQRPKGKRVPHVCNSKEAMWLGQSEWERGGGLKVRSEEQRGTYVGPQSLWRTLTLTWNKMESLEGFEQ